MAKESSTGGFVRPEVRVISKENAWEAGDIDFGEGVPSVKELIDGRLDLWTGEEGVGDILRCVSRFARRSGASSKGRIPSPGAGAHMAKVGIATNGAMEDAPGCDNKGGMDGRIKEGSPYKWEGKAEIRGREGAAKGPTLEAGGAGRPGFQA